MVTVTQVPAREQITPEETWNAESVFDNPQAWEAEYDALSEALPQLSDYDGKLGDDPATLADYLDLVSQLRRRLSKLYFYASMSSAVDSKDSTAKRMSGQIQGLSGQFAQLSAFTNPELLAIGEETLLQWVADHDDLAIYEMYIRDLFRQQQHVRSPEIESLLGMLRDPFGTASSIGIELANTDLTFDDAADSAGEPFTVTQSSIRIALGSRDRTLRQSAWENYADSYRDFENSLATSYTASVKQSTFMARARGYASVLEMQLFPHNLPTDVFYNLIDTFKKHIPTWHRYWDVKRRALGYEAIYPYDIWAPLTQNEPQISWEQAVNYIAEGMAPLGDAYVETFRKGCLEDRWVDRAVNIGKRQGAFSGGSYDTYPFIMMSFDNQLSGMSTLAHELGHSMHSYLSRQNQPEVYASYSMFAAETASNFNQAMTRAYLFEQYDDRDFQLALIQEAMDNFHRYFFIMPTLARFELEVHARVAAGKPITAEILNGLMSDLYAEGYGDTMSDDRDRTDITWAQFNHLYVDYYTFQYATGISAAHALARGIRAGEANAVENYLGFLSAGSSVYPLDALKMAGVDMTTPEAVETTFEELTELVDRLETLIDA